MRAAALFLLLSLSCLLAVRMASGESAPPDASWTRRAAASLYVVDGEDAYLQPTFAMDGGALHLEARYNYEERHALSAWVGWNYAAGEGLAFEFTPMLGAVAGDTPGVAAGFEASLAWRAVELYSESEYVHDLDGGEDSFFYTWTELSASLPRGWRAGIVAQRTRAWESERDVQRGLLLGATLGRVDLTAYAINPDDSPTWVFAVSGEF